MPAKPRFTGKASAAWIMRPRCHGPGVHVVALVPVAGPVPPPKSEVTPDISASSTCCGQMKWMWLSKPPAVRILPSPAITSVPGPITMETLGWISGLPALPIAAMRPSLSPDIGFHDAPVIEDQRVGYDGIDGTLFVGDLALPHAVADDFAAAELYFLAVGGEILLHLDNEVGVGQPHAIAGRWAKHSGIGRTVYFQ